MATKFKVELIEKMVHEWSNEEGEGLYLHSTSGYEIGYFPTLTKAIKACSEDIGYDGIIERDFFNNGFLQLCVTEDAKGCQDGNGDYLCDYIFLIQKHEVSKITESDLDKILR